MHGNVFTGMSDRHNTSCGGTPIAHSLLVAALTLKAHVGKESSNIESKTTAEVPHSMGFILRVGDVKQKNDQGSFVNFLPESEGNNIQGIS